MATVSDIQQHDAYLSPLLRKLHRYTALSSSDALQLKQLPREQKQFSRGDLLLEVGQHTHDVFILAEGWAAQEVITEDGDACLLGFLLPGDTSTINSSLIMTSAESIKCLTDVSVAMIPGKALKTLLAGNAALTLAFSLMKLANEGMARELFVNLTAKPADHKIAHLLCELSLRDAQVQRTGRERPVVHLTQVEIGAALGLSNVHVNRTIKRLREDGLVEVQTGAVSIRDWDRLVRQYRFDSHYFTQYEMNAHQQAPRSLG